MKEWVLRIAGLGLTAVSVAYFSFAVIRNAASLPDINWSFHAGAGLVATLALYIAIVVIGGAAWLLLLRGVKQEAEWKTAMIVFGLANIAKYVPGNVGHLMGRVALARRAGMDTLKVVSSLVFEAAWDVLSASVFVVLILLLADQTYFDQSRQLPPMWQLLLAAAIAGTGPFLAHWLIKHWQVGPLKAIAKARALVVPGGAIFAACLFLYVLTFVVVGAIAVVLAEAVFGATSGGFWLVTGAVTVAWVAGFLTPGSPAGTGVREAVLLALLGPIYTPGIAIGVSVAMRVVTTAGDGAAFLLAVVANRFAGTSRLRIFSG